ncbi:hypothetical protein FisN_2Hh527 [Fistulifera solaris]|uniref:GYF domain-containing protein n=1 Tax=Fistulifera solaris TaxID=1519565 RepID=A0A1Z5JGA9_FISSO|nr:hypothetical protein FisN_2Hh527 [Fistulifera solaris]|eukprot:GAX13045.1 hypothetical protein FisN_2Hh527 [Fistulifera solaris]
MSSPSSLRPAWHRGASGGGRGFQPPPQVSNERRTSGGNPPEAKQSNFNKFSALDDDDDPSLLEKKTEERTANSRSEALRSTNNNRSAATNAKGRSLADLARTSERERSASYGSAGDRSISGTAGVKPVSVTAPNTEAHVIRFTREKLLSMRPAPRASPPDALREVLEGTVILSEAAQDPVCWDVFDPDTIWASVARERKAARAEPDAAGRRTNNRKDNSRWQRGVALPSEEAKNREKDAENPSDLWDDPVGAGAAADFSAFGAMPEDDLFDFEKMAEATRKFEEEIHGDRSRAMSEVDDQGPPSAVKVDPKRPLASVGTTMQTGTADEVNVFDDFDDPVAESAILQTDAIKPGTEDKSATSKLMELIGVTREDNTAANVAAVPLVVPPTVNAWNKPKEDAAALSLNPWGTLLPGQSDNKSSGFDLQARLREAEMERQKATEMERFRQEQEHQRLLEQRQAEERAREQALRQQQDSVQSQVELVLLERISTILENSWGQSDLVTVLSALHAEDSRVIPLLNTTDALRALIIRNPRRVALRPNPVFGTETLVLLMTNAQWQQDQLAKQQHSEAISRSQQEELKRREELLQRQRAGSTSVPAIIPGAPWYYSDPQNNIQGPFRGEEMRQWLEAGYFKSDLPISQNQTGPFKALSIWFPDISVAFVYETDGGREDEKKKAMEAEKAAAAAASAAAAAAAAAQEEKERREREAAERERLAQEAAERKKREEMERQATEASPNESSNQLKMMLGLGGNANVGVSSAPPKNDIKPSKEEPKARNPAVAETPVSSPTKSAAPAWGQAAKPIAKKSMSEIQEEEARAAAAAASRRENGRPSGSGWANVAASRGGSSAWAGGAASQRPAAVIQRSAPAPTVTSQPYATKSQAAVALANAQMAAAKPQTNTTPVEDFGAQMSPALEKWCKEQMQKLNGTDDLTLVAFCMTLQDPVEIRQYLTTYLGSTPQVNNFATDFINRKSGKMTQEEWETTGAKSKARKKKR